MVAALFNFTIGLPLPPLLLLLPQWTFAIALHNPVEAGAGLASALWGDFGFCVVLIGVGYLFIARRPAQERGLIWLGVLVKGFDVFTLSYRTLVGLTYPVVLVPAAIDGAFMIFPDFLRAQRDCSRWRTIRARPRAALIDRPVGLCLV